MHDPPLATGLLAPHTQLYGGWISYPRVIAGADRSIFQTLFIKPKLTWQVVLAEGMGTPLVSLLSCG